MGNCQQPVIPYESTALITVEKEITPQLVEVCKHSWQALTGDACLADAIPNSPKLDMLSAEILSRLVGYPEVYGAFRPRRSFNRPMLIYRLVRYVLSVKDSSLKIKRQLRSMGRNHMRIGVTEQQINIFNEVFIRAFQSQMGQRCTKRILCAWKSLLQFVTDQFFFDRITFIAHFTKDPVSAVAPLTAMRRNSEQLRSESFHSHGGEERSLSFHTSRRKKDVGGGAPGAAAAAGNANAHTTNNHNNHNHMNTTTNNNHNNGGVVITNCNFNYFYSAPFGGGNGGNGNSGRNNNNNKSAHSVGGGMSALSGRDEEISRFEMMYNSMFLNPQAQSFENQNSNNNPAPASLTQTPNVMLHSSTTTTQQQQATAAITGAAQDRSSDYPQPFSLSPTQPKKSGRGGSGRVVPVMTLPAAPMAAFGPARSNRGPVDDANSTYLFEMDKNDDDDHHNHHNHQLDDGTAAAAAADSKVRNFNEYFETCRSDLDELEVPVSVHEAGRIQTLLECGLLDTSTRDPEYDAFTALCQRVFNVPIVTLGFVDVKREWFKSSIGWNANANNNNNANTTQIHRNDSLCNYLILNDCPEIFVCANVRTDLRFKHSVYVKGAPHIAFYAGVCITVQGSRVGVLSVCDTVPHTGTGGGGGGGASAPLFDAACAGKLLRIGRLLSEVVSRRHSRLLLRYAMNSRELVINTNNNNNNNPNNNNNNISMVINNSNNTSANTTLAVGNGAAAAAAGGGKAAARVEARKKRWSNPMELAQPLFQSVVLNSLKAGPSEKEHRVHLVPSDGTSAPTGAPAAAVGNAGTAQGTGQTWSNRLLGHAQAQPQAQPNGNGSNNNSFVGSFFKNVATINHNVNFVNNVQASSGRTESADAKDAHTPTPHKPSAAVIAGHIYPLSQADFLVDNNNNNSINGSNNNINNHNHNRTPGSSQYTDPQTRTNTAEGERQVGDNDDNNNNRVEEINSFSERKGNKHGRGDPDAINVWQLENI